MKTKYLFVCTVNRYRSRTADHYFSRIRNNYENKD